MDGPQDRKRAPVFLRKHTPFGTDGQAVEDVQDVICDKDDISYGRVNWNEDRKRLEAVFIRVNWNKDRKRLEAVFIDEVHTFNQDVLEHGAIEKPIEDPLTLTTRFKGINGHFWDILILV